MTEAPQILELTPAIIQQQSSTTAANAAQSPQDCPRQKNPSTIDPDKPLTAKELAFVEHYLGDAIQNGTLATKLAGFRCKSEEAHRTRGSWLLKKPNVAKVINVRRAELQAKMRENTEITREYILERLRTLAEMTMSKKALPIEGSKKTIVLYQPQAAARCWELLGKEIAGMFIDRTADVSDSLRDRERQLELVKKAVALVTRPQQETKQETKEEKKEEKVDTLSKVDG